jgi:hypothetical protein
MQLTTMQDLAGCRAIVPVLDDLAPFRAKCEEGWSQHAALEPYDYIQRPKPESGYRGIHLVYRYGRTGNPSFEGRLIEVQLRTRVQHIWATAVEIVDLFQKQSLKAERGDPGWQRFFKLMASVLAIYQKTPRVEGTPEDFLELLREIRQSATHLGVEERMRTYNSLARIAGEQFQGMSGYSGYSGSSGYFVMELRWDLASVEVRGYALHEVQKAYDDVAKAESENPNVVLVAASDLEDLREAYPNWIVNTDYFLQMLRVTLEQTDKHGI